MHFACVRRYEAWKEESDAVLATIPAAISVGSNTSISSLTTTIETSVSGTSLLAAPRLMPPRRSIHEVILNELSAELEDHEDAASVTNCYSDSSATNTITTTSNIGKRPRQ